MDLMDNRPTFDLVDWIIFIGMLGVSTLIGIYHYYASRKKVDAVGEYLVGGQKMSVFPISMSLIASYISGIALLGLPAEMYVYGTQFWCIAIADSFVSVTMAIVYLPVFYELRITSIYEYLELRFNRVVRLMGSFIIIIQMLFYIPLVIYVPALAFNQMTGMDLYTIMLIVSAVCIFYTTMGGLKAVVWTDTIQTVLMFGAVIPVAALGTARVGGVAEVWRRNVETERIEFFNMDLNPTIRHTFWSVVVGNYLNWLAMCTVNQATVQRCLAMSNLRKTNMAIIIMTVGITCIMSLCCYTGIVIYAVFYDCDPITTKQIRRRDQLLPYFVMVLSKAIPGLPGLFVSGLFSAALSTMSTGLNSMSCVIYEDMIKPCLRKPISNVGASRVIKATVVIIGVICMGFVFIVDKLSGLIQSWKSLTAITGGPLLGMFTLGMLFPMANSKGVFVGAFVSLSLVAWISFGTQAAISNGSIYFPVKPVSIDGCTESLRSTAGNLTTIVETTVREQPFFLYRMSYLWYTLVGFLITILIGLLVSWFTGPSKYSCADKRLFTPVVHCFLSSRNYQNKNEAELAKMINDVNSITQTSSKC
ncbi:sodium-coupled monocarboxylate transporter 1 isoform X2 [Monomorium pharaonis]|uniref:sodium-coupled monocarboxylate transporter 1 isoform X2 n=1 Tax=Monomorium pharaonis TaxID=307658 RepID=UPI00174644B5|nr:sodium-coupled monocarboxylate transporter 1 isoform X2 [Monomorium pharaonis]